MAPAAHINVESRSRRDLITKTRTLSYRDYFSPFIAIQGADPGAVEVILYITRIVVIEDVEDRTPARNFRSVSLMCIVNGIVFCSSADENRESASNCAARQIRGTS